MIVYKHNSNSKLDIQSQLLQWFTKQLLNESWWIPHINLIITGPTVRQKTFISPSSFVVEEKKEEGNNDTCKAFCDTHKCRKKKKDKTKTISWWQLTRLCPEPASRLTEYQNKDKELFWKIASSRTLSCNAWSKHKF